MTYTREQLTEAADVLDKAYDVILERGWWGMRRANEPTSLCMEAAIIQAVTGELVTCPALTFRVVKDDEVQRVLIPEWMEELFHGCGIGYWWNDAVGRTDDEVFERLRSVAKQLREEAGTP